MENATVEKKKKNEDNVLVVMPTKGAYNKATHTYDSKVDGFRLEFRLKESTLKSGTVKQSVTVKITVPQKGYYMFKCTDRNYRLALDIKTACYAKYEDDEMTILQGFDAYAVKVLPKYILETKGYGKLNTSDLIKAIKAKSIDVAFNSRKAIDEKTAKEKEEKEKAKADRENVSREIELNAFAKTLSEDDKFVISYCLAQGMTVCEALKELKATHKEETKKN